MNTIVRTICGIGLVAVLAGGGGAVGRAAESTGEPAPHQRTELQFAERTVQGRRACFCFASGTPKSVVEAFESARASSRAASSYHWGSTVTTAGPLHQGDPMTLTYSFIPDGTVISGGSESAGASNLMAVFDAKFGSRAAWQNLFSQIFARWTELSGVKYVLVSDDGAAFPNSAGASGSRGDIRIGGHSIDGSSNVLAYNWYPDSGDMVIDTDDANFFADAANNYRALRNCLAHEHGHGLGLDHVYPVDHTKLMEPYITLVFDGPQLDDVLSGQRNYGDRYEPNDSSGTAASLGSPVTGVATTVSDVSIDSSSDADYYSFSAAAGKRATIVLRPAGSSYTVGASASSTAAFDALRQNKLGVELRDTNGSTVLSSANSAAIGANETISDAALTAGGTYYVRVFGASTDAVQMYALDVTLTDSGPACTVSSSASVTRSSPITFTITFSQAVTGLSLNAITVTNGTKNTLSGSGSTYSLTVTPSANGDVTCQVAAGAATNGSVTNTASNTATVTYDTQAPSVTVSSASAATNANPIVFTLTFSEAVTGLASGSLSAVNGSVSSLSGSGASYSASVTPAGEGTVSLRVLANAAQDAAGNTSAASAAASVTYDRTAPVVLNVTSPAANGTYGAGAQIDITVQFSEAVSVAGTPVLNLETGYTDTYASYASGSGTDTLHFSYGVAPGQHSADLDYSSSGALVLSGGLIGDAASNAAVLTLAAPGAAGSLGANKALVVEAPAPPVIGSGPSASPNPAGAGEAVSFSAGATDADGDTLSYSWDFGDSTSATGSSVTHAYAVAGTFSAVVSVSDGNQAPVTKTISVTVLAPKVGTGADKDGDGFSDAFESSAGTSPDDAQSTPYGTAAATDPVDFTTVKASVKLNFSRAAKDSIMLSGTLAVPTGFDYSGQPVTVAVGDVVERFFLDSKGKTPRASQTVTFAKPRNGVAKFTVKFSNGDYQDALVSYGLENATVSTDADVPVQILFNGQNFSASLTLHYTAKADRSGSAK